MKTPFTIDQFLEVFKNYNHAVFPMQVVFYLISAIAIYLAIKPNPLSDKTISIILAFLWLWMGIVYHLIFFTEITQQPPSKKVGWNTSGKALFKTPMVVQNKSKFRV